LKARVMSFSGTYPALTSLGLSTNKLTSFDGSGLTALTSLTVGSNPLLPSLSFTNNKLTSFSGAY